MCQLPTGTFDATMPLSLVVMAFVGGLLFYVLVRIANLVFSSRRIAVWLEIEMADLVNSLLLLVFFTSVVAFFSSPASSQLVNSVVEVAYGEDIPSLIADFGGEEVFSTDVCLYENTYRLLVRILAEMVKAKEVSTWASSLYLLAGQQQLTVGGVAVLHEILPYFPPIPGTIIGASITSTPQSGAILAYESAMRAVDDNAIFFLTFNLLAFLLMVGKLGFFFIFLGFVLRALPGLKPVGSSLAAVGISFAVFFPLLLVGEGIAMLAHQQPIDIPSLTEKPDLLETFSTSMADIVGRGTLTAYELGLSQKVLLEVDGEGNLIAHPFRGDDVVLFRLQPFLEESSKLALYGSIVAPFNFLLVIVMVSALMQFLGEKDSILDFFLLNYR